MIEGALHAVGGQHYLEAVAMEYPVAFCSLVAKLIPKDLHVSLPPEPRESTASMVTTAKRIAFLLALADHEAKKAQQPAPAPANKRKLNIGD